MGRVETMERGSFTELIEIHKISSITTDDLNTKTPVYTLFSTEWAKIEYQTGLEKVLSEKKTFREIINFTFDYHESYMDYRMKIKYRGNLYDVSSLDNIDGIDWYIEAKAVLYG